MIAWKKRSASLALLAGVLALQGCATVKTADARDPWESMNRSVYQFNDVVDNVAIKPAAQLYVKVLPGFVRTGVGNFLGNLGDVWSMANSALQLKGQATAETFMRIHVNTVFGLGGLLDVATEMRLEKRREDFGQTLTLEVKRLKQAHQLLTFSTISLTVVYSIAVQVAQPLQIQLVDTASYIIIIIKPIISIIIRQYRNRLILLY